MGGHAKMGTLFRCCHLVLHTFCCIVENKPSLSHTRRLFTADGRRSNCSAVQPNFTIVSVVITHFCPSYDLDI